MVNNRSSWGKTIFWGGATALLYALMFANSDAILHLAHTTPGACVVRQGAELIYYHKPDAAACAAKGGFIEAGHGWHVLVPIALAFAISFVHGAFTGLFWDIMGLKAAGKK